MNIRIVHFLIDENDMEKIPEWCSRVLTSRLDWGQWGSNYKSEKVASTDDRYNACKLALKEARIRYEELNITEDYDLYVTTAPGEYDYDHNVEIGSRMGYNGIPERIVALERERADYQIGRYQSGLYITHKVG